MKHEDFTLGEPHTTNIDIELFVQEINLLFDTSPGEVMGDTQFGSDFEKFIWDLRVSNSEISKYIASLIYTNIYLSQFFDITVTTNIIEGTENDIILVNIDIVSPESGDKYKATYKI